MGDDNKAAPSALVPVDFRAGEQLTATMEVSGRLFAVTSWGRCWQLTNAEGRFRVFLVGDEDELHRPVPPPARPMSPREEAVARYVAERAEGSQAGWMLPFSELWDDYTVWMSAQGIRAELGVSPLSLGRYVKRYLPGYRSMSARGQRFVNVRLKPVRPT